ncbi:MAG: hypothetical protein AAF578_15375 [Pseudomonadota bacterium]
MSWDIFVQDLPKDAASVADIPEDFVPKDIGGRSDVIATITAVVPEADFSDPSWGLIDGKDWSIEVNIGDAETCSGFAFHVRGGDQAIGVIDTVLRALDLRAIDAQTGEFFVAGPDAQASLSKWREYRGTVVG